MDPNFQIWQSWADTLNRWGLNNLVAAFLEALGPLKLISAQIVYIGQPVLNSFVAQNQLDALTNLLEKPQSAQDFVDVLRQTSEDPSAV